MQRCHQGSRHVQSFLFEQSPEFDVLRLSLGQECSRSAVSAARDVHFDFSWSCCCRWLLLDPNLRGSYLLGQVQHVRLQPAHQLDVLACLLLVQL